MARKKKRFKTEKRDSKSLMNENLNFSFKFYDQSGKYCINSWEAEKIKGTLERLKELSEKSLNDIFRDKGVLHFHEVPWGETIEKQGFPDKRANALEAYQFSLLGINGQKARVYGAFSRGTFYIVWFDLEHIIWPTFKKHT